MGYGVTMACTTTNAGVVNTSAVDVGNAGDNIAIGAGSKAFTLVIETMEVSPILPLVEMPIQQVAVAM